MWLFKRKAKFQLSSFQEIIDPRYLLFYKGVLYGEATEWQKIKFTTRPRIHEFVLKRIGNAADVCSLFPVSTGKIKALYAAQTTTQRKAVLSRFLALQWMDREKFLRLQYTYTHTLLFGYWLNPESFIQILRLSFSVNPPNTILNRKDSDLLAIELVDFLIDQIQSYQPKIVDEKLYQDAALISVSAENRLFWLTMLLENYQFIANNRRL